MFCEELGRYLYSCNMNTIKVNANFLEVFYEIDDDNRVKALLIYDIGKKGKTTDLYDLEENILRDKVEHIKKQVVTMLMAKENADVDTISVVCSDRVFDSKLFDRSASGDEVYLVNLKEYSIVFPEDGSAGSQKYYDIVKQVLAAEKYKNAYDSGDYSVFRKEPTRWDIEQQRAKRNNTINRMIFKEYFLSVTMAMIIVNVIVHIVLESLGNTYNPYFMHEYGAAYWENIIEDGEYWRVFTSMFMHFGFDHLLGNMFTLFLLGNALERTVGKLRFFILYMLSGINAGVCSTIYHWAQKDNSICAGASGAIYGVMGAMIAVFVVCKVRSSISLRGLIVYAIVSIGNSIQSEEVDNAAHLGGFTSGLILAIILMLVLPNGKFMRKGSGSS